MNKISNEVAQAEYDRFVDTMALAVEADLTSEEDRTSLQALRNTLVRAICAGALVVNEEGEPVFTPQRSDDVEPIRFREPKGATLSAMDQTKKTEDVKKLFGAMANMAPGTTIRTYVNMKMPDLKVCIAITTLFLG